MTWSHCCLPCNAVWGAPAQHVCSGYPEQRQNRRTYWTRRLWMAMQSETVDEPRAFVDRPVSRDELVRWLGDGWRE